MLDFAHLQSQLRRAVRARILSGQISGSELARRIGLKQPHVTNFLNRRRGLSLEAMDRVLRALEISVLDLVPARELECFAHSGSDTEYEAVPLVEANGLLLPFPPASAVRDWMKFRRRFLEQFRPEPVGRRQTWLRFVLMRMPDEDAKAMYPRIPRGAVLLVDRWYNSVRAYRSGEVNIYAVRLGDEILVRSLEVVENRILLRPERSEVPMQMMTIDEKCRYAEKIVGRVGWGGWGN